MRVPRFRIRTLMIAVVVAGVLTAAGVPWWRHWFQSPWRLVTVTDFNATVPSGSIHVGSMKLFFDVRMPADAAQFRKLINMPQSQRANLTVERFATFPRDQFPTLTDDEVRRIYPPEPK